MQQCRLDPDGLAAGLPFRPPLEAAAVHDRQAAAGGGISRSEAGLGHAGVAVADLDPDPACVGQHSNGELSPCMQDRIGHQLVRGHDQRVEEVVAH